MQRDSGAQPPTPHANQVRCVRLQLECSPPGLRKLNGPACYPCGGSTAGQCDAGHCLL